MARTKQTARKACAQLVPRKTLIAQKIARKSAPMKKRAGSKDMHQEPSSDEKIPDFVNTQQFSLRFDDQDKCEKIAVQGQMIRCKNCEAYFTSQSSLLTKNEYKSKKEDKTLSDIQRQKFVQNFDRVWICQFCLSHNHVPNGYEVPKEENPCIIVEKVQPKKKGQQGGDGKILIFCIDISGSMDMSFQGKTRLQSVKEAILDEVNRLKYQKQKINVGLITFGSQVNLIGDGSAFVPQVMPTNLYKDFDGVIKELQKIKTFCYPIQKSYNDIKKTISLLTVHGSTALGPGLLAAVQLSSKGSIGSKVILCTDGQANVGMGGNFNDDRFTFYTKMAEHAKKRKVMVNILSLKGDKCNVKELGKLSLATGGSILKIDPKMLGTQFSKIVKQNVIGTDSRLVIKLNKMFKICNGKPDEVSKDQTTMSQDFGNFTQETQLNFQFDTIPKSEAQKIPQIDLGLYSCTKLPMQVILNYTGRNGWKYLQIVTDWRQITFNEDDIYQGANFSLFAASVLQRASSKIRQGQLKEADSILAGYWSIVGERFQKTQKEQDLNRFAARVKQLQRILQSRMKKGNIKFQSKSKKSRGKVGQGKGGRSISRGGARGRAAGRGRQRKRSRSRSASLMQSDSENQILYKEIRARQRSRSKQKEKQRSRSKSKSLSSSQKSLVKSKKQKKKQVQRSRQKPAPKKGRTTRNSK